MNALIIIDMQNDFMPEGPLGVKEAEEIIPVINNLMDRFDNVFASQDWHPKHHVSFASTHNKKPFEKIQLDHGDQTLWPDHCIQDTFGAELVTGLRRSKIRRVFQKGVGTDIDSYSAFFDNAQQRKTGLDEYLKELKVNTLYFTGVALDYCVKYSAIDAKNLGYDVYIILDACKGIHEDLDPILKELQEKGIHTITSDALAEL
ncbi:MAG: nicotinamidase/pyrazinamidase [Chlamydiae bacterium CG10_big_fil_rev_8_21_14_0_10_35_9]|nr:MAG: nicotinamidase/pyrazinamidase [Chlamydiae bacterium CG10_big_fil_rev_8_21_14_0_10_35_9]